MEPDILTLLRQFFSPPLTIENIYVHLHFLEAHSNSAVGKCIMDCPHCQAPIREWEFLCPVCHKPCGYPNVRAASKQEEQEAVSQRLSQAEANASRRGCATELARFREAVRSSKAVLCRSLGEVMQLVSSDNQLYASFYQLVGMGGRRPEDSAIEKARLVADALVFPYYVSEIRFAALSLNGLGVTSYGSCSLVLKEMPIRERTTVFEENSLSFCMKRNLSISQGVPPGYRATWDRRDQLAAAKLESALQPGMQQSQFAGILLNAASKPQDPDFVEVHIYGSLHRLNIESLVLRRPTRNADRALLREIERKLRDPKVGASVEIVQ